LPGETNFKPSIGTVQAVPPGVDGSFSLTIDLDEVITGETIADTRLEGGTQGVLTVTTNTNGDPVENISEVQILTVDAVSGAFKLAFAGGTATADINYTPENPTAVATAIQLALSGHDGGPTLTVEAKGTAFFITFDNDVNHELIEIADNDTTRVGTDVDPANPAEQILTVFGNGGSFTLSLDGGITKTAQINFTPDDPAVNQAQVIEERLNADLNLAALLGALDADQRLGAARPTSRWSTQ
jgi:hypothetical protein